MLLTIAVKHAQDKETSGAVRGFIALVVVEVLGPVVDKVGKFGVLGKADRNDYLESVLIVVGGPLAIVAVARLIQLVVLIIRGK